MEEERGKGGVTLKDVLDHLDMKQRIVINYYPKGGNAHITQIMNVRRMPWEKLRHWIDCNVWLIKPKVDKDGNPFLFVGIE